MKNKKSNLSIGMIIGLALGLIALFVAGVFVYKQIKGESDQTSILVFSSRDSDEDGVIDLYDRCDCVSGDEENKGCPTDPPEPGDLTENSNACKIDT
jgi:hypothetical protein